MIGDPLKLIGVPYALGVEDPGAGFDCWTLVRYVRREHFGMDTPAVEPVSHLTAGAMRAIELSRDMLVWEQVAIPGHPGDVVGMSASVRGNLHHVGIALEQGVLHAWSGFGGYKGGSVILTPWNRIGLIFKQVEVFRCRT